jgi:hypothetical protein
VVSKDTLVVLLLLEDTTEQVEAVVLVPSEAMVLEAEALALEETELPTQ